VLAVKAEPLRGRFAVDDASHRDGLTAALGDGFWPTMSFW
jgi:hypothetical protein